MPTPAVSVLVATYNNGAYLREALDTLLSQTFPDFELIVIDDGSTDDTQQVLKSYVDPRLVLLRNERRRGVAAARNRTIAASRAPLIAVADADDRYDRQRLEKQVAYLGRHPEVDILLTDYCRMTVEGRVFERIKIPRTDAQIKLQFLWTESLSHATVMCRRAMVLKTGGYDETLSSAVDADWFIRLAGCASFGVLHEVLHYYRIHSASITRNRDPRQADRRFLMFHKMLCRYLGREISAREGEAFQVFMCAWERMSPERVAPALSLASELLSVAMDRESPRTVRWLRQKIAEAMVLQSTYLSYTAPLVSRSLLMRSVQVRVQEVFTKRWLVQYLRVLFGPVRKSWETRFPENP